MKGRFAENTSPSSENAKAEQRSSQLNPPLTLYSKGEVISEPSPWVRGLKGGQDGS